MNTQDAFGVKGIPSEIRKRDHGFENKACRNPECYYIQKSRLPSKALLCYNTDRIHLSLDSDLNSDLDLDSSEKADDLDSDLDLSEKKSTNVEIQQGQW